MTKKLLIITVSFFIIIITLFILFYPLFQASQFIEDAQNNNYTIIGTGKPIGAYKDGTTFDSFNEKFYSKYEFINTNINPFNPVITIVYKNKLEKAGVDFEIYTLKRTGILEYQIYSRRFGYTRDYTYEQTLEFAKKQNLAENNPDPSKIVIKPQIQP